jgi:glyceraldehyde-3-phosphate dehydrogenase (NADP+)
MVPGERALPNEPIDVYLVNGELRKWTGKMSPVYSPIRQRGSNAKLQIGSYPMLTEKEASEALDAAVNAWDHGRGKWPQSSVGERIAATEKFVEGLKAKKGQIAEILSWFLCLRASVCLV